MRQVKVPVMRQGRVPVMRHPEFISGSQAHSCAKSIDLTEPINPEILICIRMNCA